MTRLNRHLGHPEREGSEVEEGAEVGDLSIIAGRQLPRVFELIKGAFNPVPVFGERPIIGTGAPGPGRNNRRRPLAFNVRNKGLTIMAFGGEDIGGGQAREERQRLRTVRPLSLGHNKMF